MIAVRITLIVVGLTIFQNTKKPKPVPLPGRLIFSVSILYSRIT